ncbi:MAG: hybrid sensor histidine kinase/response regulator [Caulobacteraceae bacterium]
MSRRNAVLAMAAIFFASGAGVSAARALMSPAQLAAAIERRADTTSFTELERFGDRAANGDDRESLNRLEHVAQIFLNQSEFGRFDRWNGLLARNAAAAHDQRYLVVARMNVLKSRFDRGDLSVEGEIARAARDTPDWFARVYAMTTYSIILIDEDKTGEALKTLSDAQGHIPDDDPYAGAARAQVWETIGLALMDLYDLRGSAAAFDRADFQDTNPAYPRPDFDGVYDMGHVAEELGDGPLSKALAAIHHRLAMRSELPHLKIWDMNLCGKVAEAFGTPAQVAGCFSGLDPKLSGAEFLAPNIIPMRAIAEARLGQVAAAQADLERFRALEASKRFEPAQFSRETQIEGEVDLARGRYRRAFAELREYADQKAITDSQKFNSGVHQITGELETQLENARRNAALKQDVIRTQRWVAALSVILVLAAALAFAWQRRVSARFRLAQQKAESANRSKSEFLANMSHEIRTPLNGVVGVADLLASADLAPREKQMVEIIRDSGQSLERLLSDVLDLARVEAGRMTIEEAPFQAADLVRSVAALSRLRADEKGLALMTDIAQDLEDWFLGDATRLRQILTNLVSNSVKFTPAGSVTISAHAPSPGRLRFTVADTGVGFDAEDKQRLFDRFQQADGSITRRFGGSGLGLAISRQLALLMGGEFDCDSTPGRGSTFWFEGPFPASAAPVRPLAGPSGRELVDDRAVKVLLADDHLTNQTVIRMMLDELGAETVTVSDGFQAVEAARQEVFDVILMDMQMPVMDGLDATRRIRRREAEHGGPRTAIIMLTANALPEHREASRAAGADGHLSKPVTVSELVAALDAALHDRADTRQVA